MVRNVSEFLSSAIHRQEDDITADVAREFCLICDSSLPNSELYQRYKVCHKCRFHYSVPARERIEMLADSGTFKETNRTVTSLDPLSFASQTSYKQSVSRDQQRTGLTEAVVTGTCLIGGTPSVLIVLDFGFMGGTMGCVVGEKVALAFEYAARRKQPVVAVVTSGGVRIQEGILSLMQMAKTVITAKQVEEKGLPFISVLANPSTGHAFASFANMADVIIGEPGAIMGLGSLRAIRESSGDDVASDSHTAESHLRHGMIDAVIDRPLLKDTVGALLDMLMSRYTIKREGRGYTVDPPDPKPSEGAWNVVELARHPERPTSLEYINQMVTNFVQLHGDRSYGDDSSLIWGLGQIGGQTVVIIGQERGQTDSPAGTDGRTSPEGFREIQRAVTLTSKFELPLVTLIDTPGPHLSLETEQRGLGNSIAAATAKLAGLEVPTIAVIIGEGGSEGALPLAVADRVLMLQNSFYSAVSPEEAAELMFRDESKANRAAESLRLTAHDCYTLGIVDSVIQEPAGGAHLNPQEMARHLRRILLKELADLQSKSRRRVQRERYKKFRNMGEYSSHFRTSITREVNVLRSVVASGVRRISGRPSGSPPPVEIPPEVGDGFSETGAES